MTERRKPLILFLCSYYLPGYKSGGGMRTIANTVERLGHEYDFRIITYDHDAGESGLRYEGISPGKWHKVGNAKVLYLDEDEVGISKLREVIGTLSPDLIYVNSFFSAFTINLLKLKRLGRFYSAPVVVAPCGELSEGALSLKRTKKTLFLKMARVTGLYANVTWKASTEAEAADIRRFYPAAEDICIAPDLPPRAIFREFDPGLKPVKEAGSVKLVFLSRFDRKKNLGWILPLLAKAAGDIELDVFGPVFDEKYFSSFLEEAKHLPPNVTVSYRGPVEFDKVPSTLARYHFFVMPTLGENFGHIFLEALSAGCPLLISDTTPWTGLESRGAGWDLPLDDREIWMGAVNRTAAMDSVEFAGMSRNARRIAEDYLSDPEIEKSTRELFRTAISKSVKGRPGV